MGKIPLTEPCLLAGAKIPPKPLLPTHPTNQCFSLLRPELDPTVRFEVVGHGFQKRYFDSSSKVRIQMMWGLIRLGLFSASFFAGLVFFGHGGYSERSTSSNVRRQARAVEFKCPPNKVVLWRGEYHQEVPSVPPVDTRFR
jgi:hypothetical protein